MWGRRRCPGQVGGQAGWPGAQPARTAPPPRLSPRLASRADSEGLRAWWQAGADLGRPGYDGRSALLVVSTPSALLPSPRPASSRKSSLTAPQASHLCPSCKCPHSAGEHASHLGAQVGLCPCQSWPVPGPGAVGMRVETWRPVCSGGRRQGRCPDGEGGAEARLLVSDCGLLPRLLPQAEAAGNLEVVALLQSLQGGAGVLAPGPVRAHRQD